MKDKIEYKVIIIVDNSFGEKLIDLSKNYHCWVTESKENMEWVKKAIKDESFNNSDSLETGVSTFQPVGHTEQEIFSNVLELVMDHHNEYQYELGLNALEVFGYALNEYMKTELQEFGFNYFETNKLSFIAKI